MLIEISGNAQAEGDAGKRGGCWTYSYYRLIDGAACWYDLRRFRRIFAFPRMGAFIRCHGFGLGEREFLGRDGLSLSLLLHSIL